MVLIYLFKKAAFSLKRFEIPENYWLLEAKESAGRDQKEKISIVVESMTPFLQFAKNLSTL